MQAVTKLAVSLLIGASLLSPAFAGDLTSNGSASKAPLLAGRPAGIQKAQSMSELATYGLAAGFVAVIIIAVASGPDNNSVVGTTSTSQ